MHQFEFLKGLSHMAKEIVDLVCANNIVRKNLSMADPWLVSACFGPCRNNFEIFLMCVHQLHVHQAGVGKEQTQKH